MDDQPETQGSPDDVTLVITGPFTRQQIAMLAGMMRAFEAQRPDRLFRFLINAPGEEPPGAVRALLEEVWPSDPHGRERLFWKRDR